MTNKEFQAQFKLTPMQTRSLFYRADASGFFDYGGRRWKPVKVRGKHGMEWRIDEIARPELGGDRPDLQDMDLSELKRQKAIAEVERIRQFSDKERAKLRAEVIAEFSEAFREKLLRLRDFFAEEFRDPGMVDRLRAVIEKMLAA